MQKLVFTNGGGQTIDLTDHINYGITNWEGLSNSNLNIQSQQVPFEDGAVYLDALIEPREIAVTVAIQDNNNLELRYEKKRELISVLNPKLGEGVLVYTNDYLTRQIKAVPQIPLFENKNSDDSGTLKASVAFTCCSPYWEDIEETVVEVQLNEGIQIANSGDVPVMPKIEIDGALTNPAIVNHNTNKGIKLEMTTDKTVYITTEAGEKKVYTTVADYKIIDGAIYNDCVKVNGKTVLVGIDVCIINEFGVMKHYNPPVTQTLLCITYANGVYMVGTDGQGIIRSTDAINWEIVKSPIAESGLGTVETITYVNNVWIAGGTTSQNPAYFSYSLDNGNTWIEFTSFGFIGVGRYALYYNNTYYIQGYNYFRITTDFEEWSSIEPENIPVSVIEIGSNHWLGVTQSGEVVESTNPNTWTVIATPTQNQLYKIIKLNNKYYGLGTEVVIESDDGNTWSDITPDTTLTGFRFTCATYVFNSYSFYTNINGLFTTTDLIEWNAEAEDDSDNISIVYIFGYYYLLKKISNSESEILRSLDGEHYEKLDLPIATTQSFKNMIIINNQIVIYSTEHIYVSSNGVDFTEAETGLSNILKVQSANGKYFVNSAGVTYAGDDLESLSSLGVNISHITYHNGIYYRVTPISSNGFIIYSSANLIDWTTLQTVNTGSCYGIIELKNNIVVICNYSALQTTVTTFYCFYNLEDFTQYKTYKIDKGGVFNYYLKDNIVWVCGSGGLIGQSTDGVVWQIQYTGGDFNSLCIEGKKLCVGHNSLIVEIVSSGVIDTNNNLISKLSVNSNLNWSLLQGENNIRFTSDNGEGRAIITYRQKYIGV